MGRWSSSRSSIISGGSRQDGTVRVDLVAAAAAAAGPVLPVVRALADEGEEALILLLVPPLHSLQVRAHLVMILLLLLMQTSASSRSPERGSSAATCSILRAAIAGMLRVSAIRPYEFSLSCLVRGQKFGRVRHFCENKTGPEREPERIERRARRRADE